MTRIQAIQSPYVTQPSYNAVKIEINNPQVTTQAQQPTEEKVYSKAMYEYPTAPIYDIPKQSIYNPQPPAPKAIEEPIQTSPIVPPPVVIETPIAPVPVVAEAKIIESTKPEITTSTAQDKTVKTEEKAPAKTVEIKEAEDVKPLVDVNSIISKLNSPDFEVQAKALSAVAEIVTAAPQTATELLDVKVIDTLLGIMNRNTAELAGPTPSQLESRAKILAGQPITDAEKADANKATAMDMAERNKQYSMYTVAILQKLYGNEIEKLNNSVVPITELPGAAGVVEQLKNNPNPMVRAAGIESLSYIQRPEYKQDLKTVFSVAQNDQSEIVQMAAQKALAKLEKMPSPAEKQKTETAPAVK